MLDDISKVINTRKYGADTSRCLHIVLGILLGTIAIVLTTTVACKLIDASHWSFPWITWGAAIVTGLFTAFNLYEKY
jgi:undecaprenyl pyrophosphate phosphatase UppP